MAVRQLGRLANAIILQQKLGVEFDRSIKIEMGEAVALLRKCITETENAEQRTTTSEESGGGTGVGDGGPGNSGAPSPARQPRLDDQGPTHAGPRLRKRRAAADPGKSAKGKE